MRGKVFGVQDTKCWERDMCFGLSSLDGFICSSEVYMYIYNITHLPRQAFTYKSICSGSHSEVRKVEATLKAYWCRACMVGL